MSPSSRLVLGPELTIPYAADGRVALLGALDALDASDTLTVDLSTVEELDTAGLQLLVLARQEADRRGVDLQFGEAPEPVWSVLSLTGLHLSLLGAPLVTAPVGAGPDDRDDSL